MKKLLVFLTTTLSAMCMLVTAVLADTYVRGYTRSDGTYVAPHYRSSPNNSYNDNWSVQGNTNPYTGNYGTRSPTFNDRTPDYNRQQYGAPGYLDQGGGNNRGNQWPYR